MKLMARRYLPTMLLLWAIPSGTVAQTPNTLFLTCDTVRRYHGGDEGHVQPERLFLKIDAQTSMIEKFNVDLARYEKLCEQSRNVPAVSTWEGSCFLGEDIISLSSRLIGFSFTVWQNFRIYRGSGRISGSVNVYFGYVEIDDIREKNPLRQYDIEGSCRQGEDMTNSGRAF
jgi:hypothetical protein